MKSVSEILKEFESVQLSQISIVKLLNRVDTKFLLNESSLPSLLSVLSNDYYVLEVRGQRMCNYRTVYYDTADFSIIIFIKPGDCLEQKLEFAHILIIIRAFWKSSERTIMVKHLRIEFQY